MSVFVLIRKNWRRCTDVTKTGFPYPTNGNFEWNTFVNDAIAMALSGQQPVEQALKDGAEKAQAVLDQLN